MRRVRVGTENTTRYQHLDGGLFHIHNADLTAAGLGAQHDVVSDIEGVLHIAGGVVFGYVQAGEVVVIVLNFGTLVNFKAHTGKDINDLVFDQRDGVQTAVGAHLGGHGDVHGFGGVAGCQRSLLDLRGQGLVLRLCPLLELVDRLADGGALLLGDVAQGLGQPGNLAVFAQKLLPEFRKLGLVCHSGARLLYGGAQFLDFFFHSTPRFLRWGQG